MKKKIKTKRDDVSPGDLFYNGFNFIFVLRTDTNDWFDVYTFAENEVLCMSRTTKYILIRHCERVSS